MKQNLLLNKVAAGIGAILLLITGIVFFLLASYVLLTKGITHDHILGYPIFGLKILIAMGLGISMFVATYAIKYETEVTALWNAMLTSAIWVIIPASMLGALAFIIR